MSDTIANRYRLDSQLGAGGMGAVFRAYDRLTGTTVALKKVEIPAELLDFMSVSSAGTSSGLWLALTQEFRLLASLRHPNIISVLDYGFNEERQPFYTMEILEGGQNLVEFGRDKPFAERVALIIQVLQALVYLHRYGVIHRDLKPDNVLVTAERSISGDRGMSGSQCKVLDFGLAVARAQYTPE